MVRKAREEANLSQAEAAERCQVGIRFISDLENGKPTAQLGKALQVLRALGHTIFVRKATPAAQPAGYEHEIRAAEDFLSGIGPGWSLRAHPSAEAPRRLVHPREVRRTVAAARAALGGRSFPRASNKEAGCFLGGCQSLKKEAGAAEGFRAYQSGLFVWKSAFPANEPGKRELSLDDILWQATEAMVFLRNYFGAMEGVTDIRLRLGLHDMQGRRLDHGDEPAAPGASLVCRAPELIIEETVAATELAASATAIAQRLIKKILAAFAPDAPLQSVV